MKNVYFLIILSCVSIFFAVEAMTVKQRWDHCFYKTKEKKVENLRLLVHLKGNINLKEFGFLYDEVCFDSGDFCIQSSIHQTAHASQFSPILSCLCCLSVQNDTFQQKIEVIDSLIESRSYKEKRFSMNFDRNSLLRDYAEIMRDFALTLQRVEDIVFDVAEYKTSSQDDPTHGIIVAPAQEKTTRKLIVFGFRPFKALCRLMDVMAYNGKLFMNKMGDVIVYCNYDTDNMMLFMLDAPGITTRHYKDLFFSFA